MIDGKSVLGVIPARGGSKGLLRKNVRIAAGKPLIAWTIEAGLRSTTLDRLVLSSEDPEIMELACGLGCEVPFRRPAELATDQTPGIEPVLHVLRQLPGYDYVVLLQPTSPLRTARDIDCSVELCVRSKSRACVSIVQSTEHPYLMFTMGFGSTLKRLLPEAAHVHCRQDYPKVYLLNGAIYVAETEWLQQSHTFVSDETIGFEMPRERSLDIDTEEDLRRFEQIRIAADGAYIN